MTAVVMGIDTGLSGGLALVDKEGAICALSATPVAGNLLDIYQLRMLLSQWKQNFSITMAFLEQAGSRPHQGVVSVFKFGRTYGATEAVLACEGIPYTIINPRKWTKIMFAGLEGSFEGKERSVIAAKRLYPNQTFLSTLRSRVPHTGLVDAVLIGRYGALHASTA